MTDNPFLEAWDTPFGMPPFDRIRPEHFPPAFDRGMEEQIGRDRGDRRSAVRRRASPTRSRRWSAAGDCSTG